MKKFLCMICLAVLAGCATPTPDPDEPFVDWKTVSFVIQKDSKGNEAQRWKPRDGDILVFPREEKIEFIDDATGQPVTVRPSYSVIYE